MHFDLHTSFVAHILAYYAGLEGSKVHKCIPGMKDYIQIKHELKESIAPARDVERVGPSATQMAWRLPQGNYR